MKASRIGASLVFAVTVCLAVVLGTFMLALFTNSSKFIPGTIAVEVVDDGSGASVGVSWGVGLFGLFLACLVASMMASKRYERSQS